VPWDALTRSEQRLLIRLFGGGSVRKQNAADIEAFAGLLVLTLAMREQEAAARRRAETTGLPAFPSA
jgi:hypothetical protein